MTITSVADVYRELGTVDAKQITLLHPPAPRDADAAAHAEVELSRFNLPVYYASFGEKTIPIGASIAQELVGLGASDPRR